MAYFNHAFTKIFLGTQTTAQNPNANLVNGFIITAGIPSVALSQVNTGIVNNNYGPGTYGFFNPNTYESVNTSFFGSNTCCPLVLASASLMSKDKIGPFHGGYQESNKSKMINPRYVQKVYKVETCVPQQSVISIGFTPQTAIPGLPVDNFQGGTVQSNCCYQFLCGETYYLRVDVKGSPALRFLNHNAYQNLAAYTGCCAPGDITPDPVDPTTVYLLWAKALILNPYITPFIAPVVYDYTGVAWYAPGTTQTYDAGCGGLPCPVVPAQWWTSATGVDQYAASPQAIAWASTLPNACEAGLRLFGAYVETKFGNCSFQITDFFEKEPVRLYASLVDLNGDPCIFEGLCVYNDCRGIQGMGFGEQVVRDLLLSQAYLQNFFSTDIRTREITQGDQMLNSVNRDALYTRYFILHSVPRFNNPSGLFDNDRYMLEIIVTEANPLIPVGNPALEAFLTAWLDNCPSCVALETESCNRCTIIPDAPVGP